jgi:hypothetical protein
MSIPCLYGTYKLIKFIKYLKIIIHMFFKIKFLITNEH